MKTKNNITVGDVDCIGYLYLNPGVWRLHLCLHGLSLSLPTVHVPLRLTCNSILGYAWMWVWMVACLSTRPGRTPHLTISPMTAGIDSSNLQVWFNQCNHTEVSSLFKPVLGWADHWCCVSAAWLKRWKEFSRPRFSLIDYVAKGIDFFKLFLLFRVTEGKRCGAPWTGR